METERPDLDCIMQRLDDQRREMAALRKTNSRWRAGTLLAVLGMAALGAADFRPMTAAKSSPEVSNLVKAHEFELIGSNGQLLGVFANEPNDGPSIRLFDSTGGGYQYASLNTLKGGGGTLELSGPQSSSSITLSAIKSASSAFIQSSVHPHVSIQSGSGGASIILGDYLDDGVSIHEPTDGSNAGPNLTLRDDNGFSSILGSVPLVTKATGETHQTSAASLAMFNKKGNVVWKAPSY